MKIRRLAEEEIIRAIKNRQVTACVFGLGKMGLPLALVYADIGLKVIGVDIDPKKVEMVNKGINYLDNEPGVAELLSKYAANDNLKATTCADEAIKNSDIITILIPLVVNEYHIPNLTPLYQVAEKISKNLQRDHIIIIETTLPPGTSLSIGKFIEEKSGMKLGEEFGIAHAPERTMSGSVLKDIREKYFKIIGASDNLTLRAVKTLYTLINKKGVKTVSSLTVAEAVKVFEGVYRDVNIALANELAKYTELKGINVHEVIKMANNQPYCHIHKPGAGVGGHCIPVYPYFLIHDALQKGLELRLIQTARRINEEMPSHIVWLVIKGLNKLEQGVKNKKILVLGLTYRPYVKEYRYAPAWQIIRQLRELGAKVYAYDPLTDPDQIKKMGAEPWREDPIDVIVIVTEYEEFKNMILERYAGLKHAYLIVDGRNLVNEKEAQERGYSYIGVGVNLS